MNLWGLLTTVLATFASMQAGVIDHDQVVPFAQPTPTSISQTAAINFKPQLHITNGCHPYPAVDADGNTSGGLNPTGSSVPAAKAQATVTRSTAARPGFGHRHDWEHVVVWLKNPAVSSPEILAVSTSSHSGYTVYYPPDSSYLDGNSAKIDYYSVLLINHAFRMTSDAGETQDLIMWDQMTDAARTALENTDFGDANVPFKDANFQTKLANAWLIPEPASPGKDQPIQVVTKLTATMKLVSIVIAALASLASVSGDVISHDLVVPFAQPTPTTDLQKAAVKYKPQIHISNGCHPYPAVDKNGNTSGGLNPTGGESAKCKGSGYGSQVYGRAVKYQGVYAFMYSWYMPKDETLNGLGHRHDWEACVVWVDDIAASSPKIVALSASAHSGYNKYYPPSSSYFSGNSAKIDYSSSYIVIDHSLSATSTAGETQPLIMWDQLTDAARTALENTDFGSANVPFKDANFQTKLGNAYYA
ncbi:unnamed protein product [Phytophthora lilii]|uniref:Unnamed protein product n=1 Tax=Phytophthora lilii TaxID=2077276 RepID=A0A9W6TMQ6_9STRA|nr:unnamed protein product [Phytophthora lilii]